MISIIVIAFVLDCLIGDPQNPIHPIRLMGKGIALCVALRKKAKVSKPLPSFLLGAILSVLIIGLSYLLTWLITRGFYALNYWVGIFVESLLCYFLIAPRALRNESMKVYRALKADDLMKARKNLSRIVGRDTENLSKPEIIKATIETVAENLSDGVIAPLIFICLGGAPLGMAYKAVNTLDSMMGYRDDEFEFFGKFAARLDDLVNLIPARISALLMIAGCPLVKADVGGAVRIYRRDRRNHTSPNSAQTESVCAGALGLCLGGDSFYKGVRIHKPTMGDEKQEPTIKDIETANRLMYVATVLGILLIVIGNIIAGYLL